MLQHRQPRPPWNVGASIGNRRTFLNSPDNNKRPSPNTPPSPSPSPSPAPSPSPSRSPSSANRMLTGGGLPNSPQDNMMLGAPHRLQGIHRSPVLAVRLSQMAGQVDAREGRVRRPNQFLAGQVQQTNIRNQGARKGGTAAARRVDNRQRQLARNNNINLTPPEHLGKSKKKK